MELKYLVSDCTTDISELHHFDPISFVQQKVKIVYHSFIFMCQPLFVAWVGVCMDFLCIFYIWFYAAKTRVMQSRLSAFQCRIFHIIASRYQKFCDCH